MSPPRILAEPSAAPQWQQYLLAIAAAGLGLLARELLLPIAGLRTPFLTVFAVLLILVLVVRPGPFLAAAAVSVAVLAWRLPAGNPAQDLALFAAALAMAGFAAWLSARAHDRRRAAREHAEQQREAFRVTLASIGDAVVTTDVSGHIAFINDVACRTTGWAPHDALGRPLGEVWRAVDESTRRLLPDPATAVMRDVRTVESGPGVRLLGKDGRECAIEHRAAPIRAVGGDVVGAVIVFRDISERRRAEQERDAGEARFRLMADSAPVLIWVADPSMACTWFNRPWLEFSGRSLADERGRGWMAGVHPQDIATLIAERDSAWRQRRPYSVDYRLRRADGDYRWMMDKGTPRRAADGGFDGYVGSCIDITDRKDAETALARSEAMFRRVAEANLLGVASGDLGGRIDYINDEMLRMMGRTRADLDAGLVDWSQALAPGQAALHGERIGQLRRSGSFTSREMAFVRPDGGLTPFAGGAALLAPGSSVYVGIALDLSSLQAAERSRAELIEQLRDADRRKDEFLATLAHEMRNPLAPASHALEILNRSGVDESAQASARATIDRQLKYMVRLIDDLLDISRITQGRLELRPVAVELVGLLGQAIESCRPALAASGQTVELQGVSGPLWLQADPVRLAQVFNNLLGNAAKYSPPGSPVVVRVRHAGGSAVEVEVADRGIGIAPELLPRVFEMYTQGRPGPAQSPGGLGIGLALAHRLVLMHGGGIVAHSDGPGAGSRFVVSLPLGEPVDAGEPAVAAPLPPTAPAAGAGSDGASRPRRILVVDDNVDAAATLAMLLDLTGYATRIANDGAQALEAAEQFRPDAVLLDIGLPLLDGREVARRLRVQPWGRDVVLLALTGWGQAPDRQASSDAGFDAHLVKPVDQDELLTLLERLLADRDRGQAGERAGERARAREA